MPEGDTYTRAADRIQPVLDGRALTAIEGSAPAVRKRSGSLLGTEVTGIRTHGKHLMIDLEGDLSIHVHLGMPGKVRVTAPGRRIHDDPGSVRLAMSTDAGTAWIVAAPTVEVEKRMVIDRSLARLGPDVLAPDFDWEEYRARMARYPDDRLVCDFLLDQRVLSGVGNEYKCEVLFLEGVAPDRPMGMVGEDRRIRLAERARRLMLPNAHRGKRSTTGGSQASTWVFQRSGRPCRRCRTAIVEAWLGRPPRLTFWCPRCQE